MTPQPQGSTDSIAARWLWVMRWYAVTGQMLAVVLATYVFHLPIPARELMALIAATGLSNLVLARRVSVLLILLLDVALLTEMLLLSGGINNPFAVIYIVHVALASFTLQSRQAAVVAGFTLVGYVVLLLAPPSQVIPQELFLPGLAIATLLASSLVFYFIARLTSALRQGRETLDKNERLAMLGSFAAEAAHELGSPLGTIAVAANDLDGDDAQLIRDEVERCQRILQRMHSRAGQMLGEVDETAQVSEVVNVVMQDMKHEDGARVRVEIDKDVALKCPQAGLRAALTNVLSNALQASRHSVTLRVRTTDTRCKFVVEDMGTGISPDDLEHLGEPFFSKKEGQGMGLGLFLTYAFVERMGGVMEVRSEVGQGTTVTLDLPHG